MIDDVIGEGGVVRTEDLLTEAVHGCGAVVRDGG